VVLGDLDGDGILDLVTTNTATNGANVNLGNGDGSFQAATQVATGGDGHYAVVLGDLDHDGILDIVTTNESDSANVNLGNGDGTFGAATQIYAPGAHNWGSLCLGNLDTSNPADWLLS